MNVCEPLSGAEVDRVLEEAHTFPASDRDLIIMGSRAQLAKCKAQEAQTITAHRTSGHVPADRGL